MNTKELRIYNNLIKLLINLELEGYENREKIVSFVLENIITSSEMLKDFEMCERLSILVESSTIIKTSLSILTESVEQDYEKEDVTNLGRNYNNSLLIGNLYIAHDKYLDLLGNYRVYKLDRYHSKYLVDNKLESLSIEKEIKERDKVLIKNFDLKI